MAGSFRTLWPHSSEPRRPFLLEPGARLPPRRRLGSPSPRPRASRPAACSPQAAQAPPARARAAGLRRRRGSLHRGACVRQRGRPALGCGERQPLPPESALQTSCPRTFVGRRGQDSALPLRGPGFNPWCGQKRTKPVCPPAPGPVTPPCGADSAFPATGSGHQARGPHPARRAGALPAGSACLAPRPHRPCFPSAPDLPPLPLTLLLPPQNLLLLAGIPCRKPPAATVPAASAPSVPLGSPCQGSLWGPSQPAPPTHPASGGTGPPG